MNKYERERITMPREKDSYRDNLERLLAAYPGKEVLTVAEVARYLKRDPRTVQKVLPFKPHIGISIATLARYLS
jgi:hypothetical protein